MKKIVIYMLVFLITIFGGVFLAPQNLTDILKEAMIKSYGATESYDTYKIYYNGKSTGEQGYYIKGTPYIPVSLIGKYCENKGITVNETKGRLEIDMSLQNILLADDEITNFVKTYCGDVYVPLSKLDKTWVFPLDTMEQFFKLSYTVDENGKSIKLRKYSGTERIARVIGNNQEMPSFLQSEAVKIKGVASVENDSQEDILLLPGQRVYLAGESRNYYTIEDFDGQKYYVLKEQIQIEDIDLSTVDFYAPKKKKFVQNANERINLAWQYVSTSTPQAPEPNTAIDIMAPTWFRLIVEGEGAVTNSGHSGYTRLCHENGYLVFATITNNMSEKGSTNFTTKMFNDVQLLNRTIAQYLFYSCLYDVDGINIDFEDVKDADRDGLTNFTKTMRYYTERQGLTLSIDTLIPKPWTIEYDRKALSDYVDYLAIMTYDEHYSSSKTPGSIASLPWVEQAVKDTLAEGVPKEKLLMGIPLYTRVWVVDSNNNIQSASAATMTNINNLLANNNATITYLSKEGQNYAEYSTGPNTAKIWLEDQVSITNRLYLVTTYDLAGTACWQYSQATPDIWQVFNKYLKYQ